MVTVYHRVLSSVYKRSVGSGERRGVLIARHPSSRTTSHGEHLIVASIVHVPRTEYNHEVFRDVL